MEKIMAAPRPSAVPEWMASARTFVDRLYSAGWRDIADAQHAGAAGMYNELLTADALETKAAPVGEREAFEAAMRTLPDAAGAIEYTLLTFDGERYGREGGCSGLDLNSMFVVWKLAHAAYQRQSGVVMPERKTAMSGDVLSFQSEGWNACLDEFARLNGGSHE